MQLPTLEQIEAVVKKYNLSLFTGRNNKSDINIPVDKEKSLENLCKIASENNIKTLFIYIENLEGESLKDHLINLESIKPENYGSGYPEILKKAQFYNQKIEALALEGPIVTEIFFVLSGKIISLCFEERWYLESPYPDEAMEEFKLQFQDEIEKIEEEKEEKKHRQLEIFVENLIQNEEFRKCTTERDRRHYAFYVWKKISDDFMGVDEVEPYAREAWLCIQEEERNKRQDMINKFADLLSIDNGFLKCTNMGSRKTYASNFIKNQTGEVIKSGILEQIVNSARAK